jgi:hypothetical protein
VTVNPLVFTVWEDERELAAVVTCAAGVEALRSAGMSTVAATRLMTSAADEAPMAYVVHGFKHKYTILADDEPATLRLLHDLGIGPEPMFPGTSAARDAGCICASDQPEAHALVPLYSFDRDCPLHGTGDWLRHVRTPPILATPYTKGMAIP